MSSGSVGQLFSDHAVEEIRNVEKKTRQEIEKKKEDLRQMVGERYRDLIEAADTIADMKKCSINLRDSVRHLQKYTTSKLKSVSASTSKTSKQAVYSVERYMQLSAQVKLLMEVSEAIWSRVENGNMTEATHLYMQSRQVLKNLHLDGSTTYCPILSWFPVLGQQAQALDNLRSTILNECRNLMKDSTLDSKSLAEALCSIILLENSDMTKAFEEFMNLRLSAIRGRFAVSEDMGATKLCKVISLLAATIKQAYSLFIEPIEADVTESSKKKSPQSKPVIDIGLVQHTLKKFYKSFSDDTCTHGVIGLSEEKLWSKRLPESVTNLKVLQTPVEDSLLNSSSVQSTCVRWLSQCEEMIKSGTADILLYIRTFKALSTLRQSVWDTLSDVAETPKKLNVGEEPWTIEDIDAGQSEMGEWEQSCIKTLGRRLSLWDEILRALFLQKVKSLSQTLFTELVSSGKQKLDDALLNVQSSATQTSESTSDFIWQELSGDILPDTSWRQVSIKRTREIKGGLALKAIMVTPVLHNTCQQLNSAMRQAISDLSSYVPDVKKEKKAGVSKNTDDKHMPVLSDEERSLICGDFQEACSKCLNELLQVLEGYRSTLSNRLSTEKDALEEILFLAMFCRNFCQLCDEFYNGCLIGTKAPETPLKRQLSSSMTASMISQSMQQDTSPIWDDISSKMLDESNKFLRLWSNATIQKSVDDFKASLLNLKSAVHFFDTLPTWDNVKIEEESETGSKVESEIKLPMTVSWPVKELLYSVCECISRVGGHSISRSTLQSITGTLLSGVLHTFMQLRSDLPDLSISHNVDAETPGSLPFTVTQPWALQRLYDLRVLHGLLHSTNSGEISTSSPYEVSNDAFSDLVDWLEGYIDPFDLDVFAPHLTKNIQRSIHCSSVLLGFITPPDKTENLQSNHAISKSTGNSHNIMPLTTDCGRFSYLPISSRMSKPDTVPLPASIKNHLPLSSALKQLTEVDKKMEGGRKQSLYSKLGALSSSWLSSVTSEN